MPQMQLIVVKNKIKIAERIILWLYSGQWQHQQQQQPLVDTANIIYEFDDITINNTYEMR